MLKTENRKLKDQKLFCRINTYVTTFTPSILEFDDPGDSRIKRVVAPQADVIARFETSSALAHENRPAADQLAAESFDSQTLGRRIATVA
jgi:hypothetical protein